MNRGQRGIANPLVREDEEKKFLDPRVGRRRGEGGSGLKNARRHKGRSAGGKDGRSVVDAKSEIGRSDESNQLASARGRN